MFVFFNLSSPEVKDCWSQSDLVQRFLAGMCLCCVCESECMSKCSCQPCASLAMAAFPETQLERSCRYTWLDTIVWNQRQEVERARLKLTLMLQADKTDISCSLIETPPMTCSPKVMAATVRASLWVFTRREGMYEQQFSPHFYSISFGFCFWKNRSFESNYKEFVSNFLASIVCS